MKNVLTCVIKLEVYLKNASTTTPLELESSPAML